MPVPERIAISQQHGSRGGRHSHASRRDVLDTSDVQVKGQGGGGPLPERSRPTPVCPGPTPAGLASYAAVDLGWTYPASGFRLQRLE